MGGGGGADGEQGRRDAQGRPRQSRVGRKRGSGGMSDGWRASLLLAAESRERHAGRR